MIICLWKNLKEKFNLGKVIQIYILFYLIIKYSLILVIFEIRNLKFGYCFFFLKFISSFKKDKNHNLNSRSKETILLQYEM